MSVAKETPKSAMTFAANVVIVGAIIAALYFAQAVFIPLTLATMLAFLLAPLADRLESRRIGRIPTVVIIAFIAFSIIGGFLWVVGREATKLAANVPTYQAEIVKKVENFSSLGSGTSKSMSQLGSAISRAMRRSDKDESGEGDRAKRDDQAVVEPIDDLDMASSVAIAEESERPADEETGPPGTADNPLHVVSDTAQATPAEALLGTLNVLINPLANLGLVLVFTIFMLVSRDDLRDRMIRVLSGGRYIVTTKAINEASRRISGYILAQTIVNVCYGFCIGLGLWIIGLTLGGDKGFPNFALWGLMCTVLRFVPYVGPIIAGAFPVLLSLIVFPGFGVFAATALLFVIIELGSNNVLEPWLYGSSTGMSAMAIIIAAAFWTWMWGPVGLLLATPLTASLVVLGKYVPQLRPLTVLLGDKTPLPGFVSFYQRMLADDVPRATKILEAAIEETDVETASDDVLLPVIRRIRRDRAANELGAPREHKLMQQITQMIDDVLVSHCKVEESKAKVGGGKDQPEGGAVVLPPQKFEHRAMASSLDCQERVSNAVTNQEATNFNLADDDAEHCEVVGCTAHHESEEPALKMLAYCLSEHNVQMRWAGTRALPTDVEDWMERIRPKVIVVAIVPPDGMIQARYIVERLHEKLPESQIVVAFFGKIQKYDAVLVKFRRLGASYFTTSLNQTRIQIVNALRRPLPTTPPRPKGSPPPAKSQSAAGSKVVDSPRQDGAGDVPSPGAETMGSR